VAGGACTGGGVSVVARGGACAVSSSPAGGGASAVSSSSAGGVGNVGQLPLASGVEPSGHDCAYEGCSIDDDCTVRIAAVTRITLIIIDSLPFISVINFSLLLNSLSNNLYQGLKGGTDEIISLPKGAYRTELIKKKERRKEERLFCPSSISVFVSVSYLPGTASIFFFSYGCCCSTLAIRKLPTQLPDWR
jgi:hypothetical protein